MQSSEVPEGGGARQRARRPPVVPGELSPRTPIGASGLPGASVLRRLAPKLGIRTVGDLLFHLPRAYVDLRELSSAAELARQSDGQAVSARLQVAGLRVEQTYRRRVQRTIAYLRDDTGEVEATWFGRRFIERRLRDGDWVVVSGKVRHRGITVSLDNPDFQRDDGTEALHAGRIVPVYRLTEGLTAPTIRRAIREALDRVGAYSEYLPPELVTTEELMPIATAVEEAHYPASFDQRDAALRRLAFDELLAIQLGMVARRRARARERSRDVAVDETDEARVRSAIVAGLARRVGSDVELTPDQQSTMDEVRRDLAGDHPMLRLLQGDVGSGKTAVAAYALALAATAGMQGALLAPTDLLARQHAATLTDLLADLGLEVTLLTGSLRGAETAEARGAIAEGRAAVIVGTHALLQERVTFPRLGLAIVDEQHRFGVEQRAALEAKAEGHSPHVLLMTATPIPRTLGQVLYADLDVSSLHTPPAGRLQVKIAIRRPDELDRLWAFVRSEAAAGHRSFVVVPLIDESGDEDGAAVAAAEAEASRLAELLAPLQVGMVHGRMRPAERDEAMAGFRDGSIQVLVGTTVVEVGVDVPEATVMLIEAADRFGLAQLHQLRGRVGRGTAQSYCVLVSDAAPGSVGYARLKAVVELADGFALADADLELRREGDVLGFAQSGLPRLRVATLQRPEHRELAVHARAAAEGMLDPDGSMSVTSGLRDELARGWLARAVAGETSGAA